MNYMFTGITRHMWRFPHSGSLDGFFSFFLWKNKTTFLLFCLQYLNGFKCMCILLFLSVFYSCWHASILAVNGIQGIWFILKREGSILFTSTINLLFPWFIMLSRSQHFLFSVRSNLVLSKTSCGRRTLGMHLLFSQVMAHFNLGNFKLRLRT